MWNFHRHYVSISGVLMFGILQGMCGVLADTVKVLKVGSSLHLPVQLPMESVLFVHWRFNGRLFAEYSNSTIPNYKFLQSQFSGRLKKDHDRVGLTVEDLQPQDSGTFSVAAVSIKAQYPTQIIKVNIQSPITAVQIKKSQTWLVSTNSCNVDVTCETLGANSISYLWSGYKTASGAHLQFSLSPEEGTITLNCTAANNVSSSSAAETLNCVAGGLPVFVWIAVGGGAGLILLICLIAAFSCWWRSRKSNSAPEDSNTLYTCVKSLPGGHKDKRSDSVVNGTTLYETVDDFRVNQEMTIYSKVTLPGHTKVEATSSSPYQQVL